MLSLTTTDVNKAPRSHLPLLGAVRKELRRQTGHNADEKEIERILQAEALRSDLLV
ncbi:hypothetical protein GCM10023074_25600 [Microbispora amethystogenes]|uniref:Uncharacterized protein n=1 Tax=Microbispora amethystogenes TaxID=1427754 RepID=A0ABQ4F8B0_9ACTN|nr:hypothetical protein Mam01_12190 [Microbispora amethystogenes]